MHQSIPVVPIPPRSTPGIHIFAKKWQIIWLGTVNQEGQMPKHKLKGKREGKYRTPI